MGVSVGDCVVVHGSGRRCRTVYVPQLIVAPRHRGGVASVLTRSGGAAILYECRDGAVVRALASHQCGPGSIPRLGVIRELSLLVLCSALRGFFPGTPVFPLLKNQHLT